MHRLWPQPHLDDLEDLDDAALAAHYAWPEARAVPVVRVNFVASLDGAVTVDGRSGGLGNAADRKVFHLLRELAEVVLVGAGTVARRELQRRAAEHPRPRHPAAGRGRDGDGGPRPGEPAVHRHRGAAADPDGGVRAADRRAALAEAGGDVVVLPRLTPDVLLGELARRGLDRVLCEGGPSLLGTLQAADAVDELCLTVAPVLVGGEAGRIARGPAGIAPRRMALVGALQADDALLLRYRRSADPADAPPV